MAVMEPQGMEYRCKREFHRNAYVKLWGLEGSFLHRCGISAFGYEPVYRFEDAEGIRVVSEQGFLGNLSLNLSGPML